MRDQPGWSAEDGGEMGLEGLAGPVKRFGPYLTGNAEPSKGSRQGRDMGSLVFQQDLPNHSWKNGLDKAVSPEWAGAF